RRRAVVVDQRARRFGTTNTALAFAGVRLGQAAIVGSIAHRYRRPALLAQRLDAQRLLAAVVTGGAGVTTALTAAVEQAAAAVHRTDTGHPRRAVHRRGAGLVDALAARGRARAFDRRRVLVGRSARRDLTGVGARLGVTRRVAHEATIEPIAGIAGVR